MQLFHRDGIVVGTAAPSLTLSPQRLSIGLLYLTAYLAVDWLAGFHPHEMLGIPPWNPRPAIALALLLLGGFSWMPWLVAGALATVLLPKTGTAGAVPGCLTALTEACIYSGAAWLLKRRLRVDPDLGGFDDVFRFIGVIAAAAALMAMTYVFALWMSAQVPAGQLPAAVFHYWVADMVGGLVMGPFLLVNRQTLHHPERLKALLSWECLALAAFVGGILYIIFPRTVGSRFYPMFIPLVWIAARYGLSGAASVLLPIQAAFAGCIAILDLAPNQIVKLQILMLSLAATGLLLGAVISERERARRSVIQGQARLKAIIDMAPDGMALVDEEGRIEMINRQFEALSATPATAILGRPLESVLSLPALAGDGERTLHRTDGTQVPVETSTSTIEIGERLTQVVAVRDISARRRAAVRLGQRRAELESASRSNLTEELAAALAHELNQPLAAVITYTGACQRTLAGTDIPPRAREQLSKAAAQAERAGHVLRRLREFFRNATVEAETVAVTDLIGEVLLLLADEAARREAEFDLSVPPELTARIDRLQVEQVLINLLRNSMDAMDALDDEDRRVRITAQPAGDGMIAISVADNGPGISQEVTEDLFRPFATTRRNGMGLGLSISRSLIQANGGRLWLATPQDTRGATLTFTVPAAGA
ncbi:ATP-binding protein [Telmatospirillum siberiense]|uniref:ATP-binding protein n=1 Tax=Telmatospirillum siberiense TaxID=382514 RepID=UPI00130465F9|nr:ATP-binding protein [Telmatospirillum siberiense]